METKRFTKGRWLAKGCCVLGLCGWALSSGATGIKGLGSSHDAPLPGAESLLGRSRGKELAGVLAHGARGKGVALAEEKGAITVAAGINAFLPALATPKTNIISTMRKTPALHAFLTPEISQTAKGLASHLSFTTGLTLRPISQTGRGVVSDGSLGTGNVTYNASKQTYTIPASVGAQMARNLFESFTQFNLLQNETAEFTGPSSVQNILARITGGTVSSIDGAIVSNIQGANLFLINPAGFLFGPNASVNVSGAFTLSTANSVALAGGGIFNASIGAPDILTAGAVSGFGFTGTTPPASVSFQGTQLSLTGGRRIECYRRECDAE